MSATRTTAHTTPMKRELIHKLHATLEKLVHKETATGTEEVKYPSALSAGSHHADWFASLIPDVAAAFREPQRSRALFEEAATCLDIIQRAYAAAKTRENVDV